MDAIDLFGTRITRYVPALPPPDNNNQHLKEEWMTPAELFQWIRQAKEGLRRELAADPTLLSCPNHREKWQVLDVLENAARWRYRDVG